MYFFIHGTSSTQRLGIDAVYEYLVPKHLHNAVKEVSVMGGIGMTVSRPESLNSAHLINVIRTIH